MNTHSSILQNQSKYLTSPQMVKDDWLRSGIRKDIVQSNQRAILQEAQQNLNAWIEQFVYSFKPSRLRETLENCQFLREEGNLLTTTGKRSGLAVIVRPHTISDFRFLRSKSKQIRYKILTLDPAVNFLVLTTPNLYHMDVTDIASGWAIEVLNNGEVDQ